MKQTECLLCQDNTEKAAVLQKYNSPDKYQGLVNANGQRAWYQCPACEFIWQENDLTDDDLEEIYINYRNTQIRKRSVQREFDLIINLPTPESENKTRWYLFEQSVGRHGAKVLDIGSGLGVWPYIMQEGGYDVTCLEPNRDCAFFINNSLGINCYPVTFDDAMNQGDKYPIECPNIITCVHFLEHIRDPIAFLRKLRLMCRKDDILFVEAPDADEFRYLPKDHDEFNSCHLWFFNAATLDRMLRMAGFSPYLIKRVYYEKRNLRRLMAVCSIQQEN